MEISNTSIETEAPAPAAVPTTNGQGHADMLSEDEPEPKGFVDPYADLNLLGDDDDDDFDDGPELITVRALAGKPPQYFRVHPDREFTTTGRIVEYQPPDGGDKESYFVLKPLWKAVLLADDIRKVRFHLVVDQRMNPFIWPVKIADGSSGIGDLWATSAKDMAHRAMTDWIKIRGDKSTSSYVPKYSRMDLGEPRWPEGKTFNELLLMAYGSKFLIDSLDHPIINKL